MVGNTGTLMTMRIVRSKLRKRDESSATAVTAVTIEAQQQHQQGQHQSRSNSSDNNHYQHETHDQQIFTTTTAMADGIDNNNSSANSSMELETITFARTSGCNRSNGWVFPPKAPSPNISNCVNHDAMNERNGFKGFKKQFSGRFKRLVSNKKDAASSPIPPELKPQLKAIYVY